jgi:hypothetical protein
MGHVTLSAGTPSTVKAYSTPAMLEVQVPASGTTSPPCWHWTDRQLSAMSAALGHVGAAGHRRRVANAKGAGRAR